PAGPRPPSLWVAPEASADPLEASPRATLYAFGAMLYSLLVGRDLASEDFDAAGEPVPFLERRPDAPPAVARRLPKTLRPGPSLRFPTADLASDDPSGFQQLLEALDAGQRTVAHLRLEAAAWTTTGMVRGGNEDAVAVLVTTEARQNDLEDFALVLLADGMGG